MIVKGLIFADDGDLKRPKRGVDSSPLREKLINGSLLTHQNTLGRCLVGSKIVPSVQRPNLDL